MVLYFNSYSRKKKLKRIAQQKKNRHHQLMFQMVRMRNANAKRARETQNRLKPHKSKAGKKPEWSEKVSTVRNRLTGKKRTSKERWNRFAGTSGGGGRGL